MASRYPNDPRYGPPSFPAPMPVSDPMPSSTVPARPEIVKPEPKKETAPKRERREKVGLSEQTSSGSVDKEI